MRRCRPLPLSYAAQRSPGAPPSSASFRRGVPVTCTALSNVSCTRTVSPTTYVASAPGSELTLTPAAVTLGAFACSVALTAASSAKSSTSLPMRSFSGFVPEPGPA